MINQDTLITAFVIIVVVFLLIMLIWANLEEWYSPYVETIVDEHGGKSVVLWYNHVTDEEVKREYKILFRL